MGSYTEAGSTVFVCWYLSSFRLFTSPVPDNFLIDELLYLQTFENPLTKVSVLNFYNFLFSRERFLRKNIAV